MGHLGLSLASVLTMLISIALQQTADAYFSEFAANKSAKEITEPYTLLRTVFPSFTKPAVIFLSTLVLWRCWFGNMKDIYRRSLSNPGDTEGKGKRCIHLI